MLLTCENCETIFRIEATQIANPGQQVRCSVCRHVWAPEIEEQAKPEQRIVRDSFAILRRPLLICGLIIICFSLLSFNRGIITSYVPSAIGLYDMTGLTIRPDLDVLEVQNLNASFQGDNLRISGDLANIGSFRAHAAPLQLIILDEDGVMLHNRRLQPTDSFINAGGATDFFIQISIEDARQAEIRVEPLAIRLSPQSAN